MGPLQGKKVAVIGLGRMGLKHVKAYLQAGALVSAGSDMRAETKEALSASAPSTSWYQDWKELLQHEQLDMVSVVTNGPSHADIVVMAAEKKVPVIMCEKPMATSVADAKRMIDACEASGSKLYVNFTLRFFNGFKLVLDTIAQGAIGEVKVMSVYIGGARGLGCVGSHYVDMMRLCTSSEVSEVRGTIDTTGTPNPRGAQFKDPGGYGMYTFANGARGFLEMSEDYPTPPYVVIVGTQGRITVDVAQNKYTAASFSKETGWASLPLQVGPEVDITEGTKRMLEGAQSGNPSVSTGKDGLRALEMILALHLSDRNHAILTFPYPTSEDPFDVPMT